MNGVAPLTPRRYWPIYTICMHNPAQRVPSRVNAYLSASPESNTSVRNYGIEPRARFVDRFDLLFNDTTERPQQQVQGAALAVWSTIFFLGRFGHAGAACRSVPNRKTARIASYALRSNWIWTSTHISTCGILSFEIFMHHVQGIIHAWYSCMKYYHIGVVWCRQFTPESAENHEKRADTSRCRRFRLCSSLTVSIIQSMILYL